MTGAELLEAAEVNILRLQPGDSLVVLVPDMIDAQTADDLAHMVKARLPEGFDVPVLVCCDGVTLAVLRPEPATMPALEIYSYSEGI